MQFLSTDNLGGYFWHTYKPLSRYQGWFLLCDSKMTKIIDAIEGRGVAADTPLFSNTLIVEQKRGSSCTLVFDIRQSYENPQWNRSFIFEEKENILWVHYSQSSLCIGIACDGEYRLKDKWIQRQYPFDALRNSPPFSLWVYEALEHKGTRLMIAVGKTKAQVEQQLRRFRYHHVPKRHTLVDAYKAAQHSLLSLRVYNEEKEIQGLYGGLPWFFQYWTRDMAISARALSFISPKEAVYLLSKECSRNSCPSYREVTQVSSKLSSADGKMFVQLCMRQLGMQEFWQEYEDNELVYNQEKETWMDTISRAGARIELQSLKLALIKGRPSETAFAKRVREEFMQGNILFDGLQPDGSLDIIKRPNVFLAAYIYPDLLTQEQWEHTFDVHLEALWLAWGGLASVDSNNPAFHSLHTGEAYFEGEEHIPASYHQGDSWFWINNVAAIALHRVNPNKYEKYIKRIVEASTKDLLKKGIPGHASELSSAKEFAPAGSPVQLWSAATYIELYRELHF